MNPIRIVAFTLALAATAAAAHAQGVSGAPGVPSMGQRGDMPMHQPSEMHGVAGTPGPAGMGGMAADDPSQRTRMPMQAGQAAFGAAQEIVRMLLADPMTNWSKVNIDLLRQHLIDMNEVVMRADVRKQPIDHGLRIDVTGRGRTLEAIQRMIQAHADDINGLFGWAVQAEPIPDGQALTVTSSNPAGVQKIRALGFMGILVLGTHQMHHLAMAKGEMMSMH